MLRDSGEDGVSTAAHDLQLNRRAESVSLLVEVMDDRRR